MVSDYHTDSYTLETNIICLLFIGHTVCIPFLACEVDILVFIPKQNISSLYIIYQYKLKAVSYTIEQNMLLHLLHVFDKTKIFFIILTIEM